MKLLQKYLLVLFNLTIVASLCFASQNSVSAHSQAQAANEVISPPLFPDLTWKNLGNIRKDVSVYNQTLALNGDMFEAVGNFQNEIPESVFDYYSIKNLLSLGWSFVGNASFESIYWHSSGRYLTVQIVECANSETDYCVNIWQSVDSDNVPPPAGQLTTASVSALATFNKTAPANGSTIALPSTTHMLLQWSDAEIGSTDRYQYCIDETNNGECDSDNWITRNSLYSGGPSDFPVLAGHTYYWQVRVRDLDKYANSGNWWSFTIQQSFPIVQSIVRLTPNPTNANIVYFVVTFSQVVTGVDAGDFSLVPTGVSGAGIIGMTGSGQTYTVAVNTGSGSGTIQLNLIDNDSIKNSLNNPLGGTGAGNGNFTTGEIYTIDKTPPTVLSSRRANADPAAAISVVFTVTFSESVTGVDKADFTLTKTGAITGETVTGVTGGPTIYTVSVNTGTGNGTVRLNVVDDDSIKDVILHSLGGEGAGNGSFTSGETYTLNRNMETYIGGIPKGTYLLTTGQSLRANYAGVDSGPVKVVSTDGTQIIAAIRDAWAVNVVTTSFSQLMGLPLEQLSNKYVFPGYNNVTLNEQLRIANVDTVQTTVTVMIGGVLRGTYTLYPPGSPLGASAVRVNYPGLDSGPVIVEGTIGVDIISAIREAWAVNGVTTSFVQLMGLPAGQLSNKYVFPAYNNVTLNEQLRIANVDAVQSTVTVTIGGELKGTYTLYPPGALEGPSAVRVNYPDLDSGPVVVEGTAGVDIISSIRDAWAVNGVTTSFSQLMGMPAGQLSNKYVFPAYNNVTLNEQLRISNVDTVETTVTVTIGGVLRGTYTLYPPGSPLGDSAVRINYPGLDSGPVVVEGTAGVDLISAIRDAWAANGVTKSFVQLMGLPASQLSTTFLFPAYNNVTLNEQLRFGVP